MNTNLIKSEIKLTIGILVSNRIRHIRACMEALQPLLSAVPSELVAIDTKGEESDGSIDIVREYTDKVYYFPWINDFAAARNFCLEHAQGEWFLYLDDDEVFDDVQELVEFFQGEECEVYRSGYYSVKNHLANGGERMSVVGRMVRRREDTCFVGKVHECFAYVEEPHKIFSCFVHHYGYSFATDEERKAHQERNVALLQQELKEKGMTPRICAQMAQELLGRKATADTGYEFCMLSAKKLKEQGEIEDGCSQWLLAASVRYYKMQKDFAGALKQVDLLKNQYTLNAMAELTINGILTELAVQDGKEYSAHLAAFERAWDWLDSHPQEALVQNVLDFTNYYCDLYKEKILSLKKKTYPKLIKSEIKLTVGMLVSNHVQYIRKCMEALKPLLDAVPSELVVIDTKGDESDGSIDIVREYTDKIYRFDWCNDFSAARNFCLDHAQGEWFLYQDDDEWFDDVQEFIDFFVSGECEEYYSGYYYTRDYEDDTHFSMGIAGRMVRRTENTRFVGKVHETFNEVFAPNKQFSCFTHHMGYRYATPTEKKAHQERNLSILKCEIEEHGYTPRICAQTVQELMTLQETAKEGYEFAEKCFGELEKQGQGMSSCAQWILASRVRYFSVIEDYDGILTEAEGICGKYELSQMAKLAIAAVVCGMAAARNDMSVLEKYIPVYMQNWDWLQEHKEEVIHQTQLDFPRFHSENYYFDLCRIGAIVANRRENYTLANSYWKRLPLGRGGFDASPYYQGMQETMTGLKKQELAQIADMIEEAGKVVRENLVKGERALVAELLATMQEAVIAYGNKAEQYFGENKERDSALEQCCEMIWQAANEESLAEMVRVLETAMESFRAMFSTKYI